MAPRPRAALHNFLATGICQGGGAGAVNLAAGTTSGGNATHPLWLAGLQVRATLDPERDALPLHGIRPNIDRIRQGA